MKKKYLILLMAKLNELEEENKNLNEINKTMPLYKAIRGLTITQEPIIKTTTGKIKRYEELAKIEKRG